MSQNIRQYVFLCAMCTQAKKPWTKPVGLLQPLPTALVPWSPVSVGFIVDCPYSESCLLIMLVVDPLTKIAHFIPFCATHTASETVNLFLGLTSLLSKPANFSPWPPVHPTYLAQVLQSPGYGSPLHFCMPPPDQ